MPDADDEGLGIFELTTDGENASYSTNIPPAELIDLLCDIIDQQSARTERPLVH